MGETSGVRYVYAAVAFFAILYSQFAVATYMPLSRFALFCTLNSPHLRICRSRVLCYFVLSIRRTYIYAAVAFLAILYSQFAVPTYMLLSRSGLFCTLNSPYLLKSYLNEHQFETKINGETSSLIYIHSGVPQGSILGPLLYVLYISGLPTSRDTILGTFADDTAIFATHEDPTIASLNLQEHLHIIEKWLKKWNIKVNESKSSHITLTLRKGHCLAVNINQTIIPQTEVVKYL